MDTIKIGDRGAAVEDVQQRLVTVGHLAQEQVTGVYDEGTAQAVRDFCANVRVPVSGEVSEKVWAALVDTVGHLAQEQVTGVYDEGTAQAVRDFCANVRVPVSGEVSEKVWAALVDASYNLGDRTLYLRMPYFHGHDVLELQQALGALGFFCGVEDAIFGAHTELALRNLQTNLGLPSDGIAGAYTYAALRNLAHSWAGKEASHLPRPVGFARAAEEASHLPRPVGFARAADVLEAHALCLFGTDEFTRSVASRMSNLAQATNPTSKIVSADALSVPPDESMLLVHVMFGTDEFTRSVASRMSNLAQATNPTSKIVSADALSVPPDESMLLVHVTLDATKDGVSIPAVAYNDEETLPVRLRSAIEAAHRAHPPRIAVVLPGQMWEDAGPESIPAVAYNDEETLPVRLRSAIEAAHRAHPPRIAVVLPGQMWEDAGPDRSAQHFAITLLDALCAALA